ncbi:MAG: hypothetical protein NW207_09300 [Cytophagales bacterium]|nr:hypothetical protein [Cytophagales bacterium]
MNELLQELNISCDKACQKNGECTQLIQLYIDGVACREKNKEFLQRIYNCEPCQHYFHIHDCIKTNLKSKVNSKDLPEGFEKIICKCLADSGNIAK